MHDPEKRYPPLDQKLHFVYRAIWLWKSSSVRASRAAWEFRLGSRLGHWSGVHHSVAASSLVARSPHPLGEFAACFSLRVNGVCSPDRGILYCGSACRRGMDTVGFRTLGGGAARDAGLGARPHERHGHHDLAGSYGAWGSDLGLDCCDRWIKLYLAWSSGSVPHKPGSDPAAFNQLCTKPRTEGFRPFIYSC